MMPIHHLGTILLLSATAATGQDMEIVQRQTVKDFYKMLFAGHGTISEFASVYCDGRPSDDAELFLLDSLKYQSVSYKQRDAREYSVDPKQTESYILKRAKDFLPDLTQNLSFDQIASKIDIAPIDDQGLMFSAHMELVLSSGKTLHFTMGADQGLCIDGVYLVDGRELSGAVAGDKSGVGLKLVGGVRAQGRGAPVYETPHQSSKIVGYLEANEHFYYTASDNEWLEIFRSEVSGEPRLGYLSSKHLIKYSSLPEKTKSKIKNERREH